MQRNWVHSPHCPQTVKLLLHCLIRQAKIMCIKPLPNRSCSISMQATLMEQSIGATYMYPHVLHPKPKPVNHGACPPAEIHLRGFATRVISWNRTRVTWNSQLLNMQNGCPNPSAIAGKSVPSPKRGMVYTVQPKLTHSSNTAEESRACI